MPAKGLFTTIAAVLLDAPVDTAAVARALTGFEVLQALDVDRKEKWMGGYPGVLVSYRPEVHGAVLVDVIDAPWPDGLGSPDHEPELFAAWSAGWLGPFTYPGALERAVAFADIEGKPIADKHRAWVRVMTTYALGPAAKAAETKLIPDGYDARAELDHATKIAAALAKLPGALGVFHPAGETLHTAESLEATLVFHRTRNLVPYDAWSAVRLFRVDDKWSVMDTVGMAQLGAEDHEACFTTNKYEPGDVANFLRNAADFSRSGGKPLARGDTMAGPGDITWKLMPFDQSLSVPPRPVIRWLAEDGTVPPGVVLVP